MTAPAGTPIELTPEATAAGGATVWRRLVALQVRWPLLQLVALVLMMIIGTATLPDLLSGQSIRLILVLGALAGMASIGQTILILLGGFDLSVAGFIVAGALMVTQVASRFHWSFGEALAIAVVGAAVLGAIAGQICHRFEINPLIITLAIGTLALGLAQTMIPGGLTYGASAPEWLIRLTSPRSSTFGLPVPPMVTMWIAATVVLMLFLHRTVVGRRLMATGANRRAAGYSLIRTGRFWTIAFAFSAIMSVGVGLLVAGTGGAITTEAGDPYLFQSAVAVIVGGTVFGGPGDYSRTVVGALFLAVLNTGLLGNGASASDQQIIYGLAILISVSVYSRERRLRDLF
jgi:ribose transport system permease protein